MRTANKNPRASMRPDTTTTITYEGGEAKKLPPERILERALCASLLWERKFYIDGTDVSDTILSVSEKVSDDKVVEIAHRARNELGIRHAPLMLAVAMFEQDRNNVGRAILDAVIRRADEPAEVLSLWWRGGKRPIPAKMKKALADAYNRFDRYQLAKYKRARDDINMVDVFNLVHPKPTDSERERAFRNLMNGNLTVQNTWESGLSKAKTPEERKRVFVNLLSENKLGALALLRNLRLMMACEVPIELICKAMERANWKGILAHQFIASYMALNHTEFSHNEVRILGDYVSRAMVSALRKQEKILARNPVILLDVSGSMFWRHSGHSDMMLIDSAIALAIGVAHLVPGSELFIFSDDYTEIKYSEADLSLLEKIKKHPVSGDGTMMARALDMISREIPDNDFLVVITDEQSHDSHRDMFDDVPSEKIYIMNVAGYENSVEFDERIVGISGLSMNLVKFIAENEKLTA